MLKITDMPFVKNPHASPKLICKILPEYLCKELIAASEVLDKRARLVQIRKVEIKARRLHRELFNFD